MKPTIYKFILFIIIANVLATIGLQVFWNIKNYKENKTQLVKDVQTAFDNSIEYYYVEDSKNDFLAIYSNDSTISNNEFINQLLLDSVFKKNKIGRKSASTPETTSKFAILDTLNLVDETSVQLESITFTPDSDEIEDTRKNEEIPILKTIDNRNKS